MKMIIIMNMTAIRTDYQISSNRSSSSIKVLQTVTKFDLFT